MLRLLKWDPGASAEHMIYGHTFIDHQRIVPSLSSNTALNVDLTLSHSFIPCRISSGGMAGRSMTMLLDDAGVSNFNTLAHTMITAPPGTCWIVPMRLTFPRIMANRILPAKSLQTI